MKKHKHKQRKTKETTKLTIFRFWNNGVEYFCNITSSIDTPKYRLAEAFNRNFVGKKDINILKYHVNDFKKLDVDSTYEVKPVKEK